MRRRRRFRRPSIFELDFVFVRFDHIARRHHKRGSQHRVNDCGASRSRWHYPACRTTADRTAARRKSDRRRDDPCAVGLRKCVFFVPVKSPERLQRGLDAIPQPVFATFPRAVGAAKNFAAVFHTVADDFAPAVITFGRNNVDRALEAVEDVRFPLERDLECLVIFISAMFAFSHKFILHFYILFRWVVIEIDQAFRPRVGISFTR